MKAHYLFCITLCICGLESCQMKESRKRTEEAELQKVSIVKTSTAAAKKAAANVEILLSSQYRKESGYPQGVGGKEWFELYFEDQTGQWKAAPAHLKISNGYDQCVGDSTLIVRSENSPILFFTHIENMLAQPKAVSAERYLIPERTVGFTLNNHTYKLLPMGSFVDEKGAYIPMEELKGKSKTELLDYSIKHYQLSFVMDNGDPLLLTTQEEIQNNMPQLLWAGDLNNDGLADLIIDVGDFYESKKVMLFLSDPADQREILKKVAEITVTNDC